MELENAGGLRFSLMFTFDSCSKLIHELAPHLVIYLIRTQNILSGSGGTEKRVSSIRYWLLGHYSGPLHEPVF